MKKIIIIIAAIILYTTGTTAVFANSSDKTDKNITIKNNLFSFNLPADLKGKFVSKIKRDYILIFDKASKKANFGGFAFGIKVYKNPADHAEMPGGIKIGELTDKKNVLYDVVLLHPTDVQYDYTKGPEAPETYKRLYNIGDVTDIQGVKGAAYHKNQGMKGEDLYKEVLKNHIEAIKENSDSDTLESKDMSYMYNVLAKSSKNVLDKVGYTYYDLNGDGIEELLIGEIAEGDWKGVIYDIYTMVNRKPAHVVSGGSRNRYFACDNTFICNEYSSGAGESGVRIYILIENSTELFPQVSFKYDSYKNKQKPWFISYGSELNEDKWENVSEEFFKERKNVFESYERFNFTPLSKVKF